MSKLRMVVIAEVKGKSTPIFTLERAIHQAKPFGNFASGKVSVKGKRYSIVLDTDKQIYQGMTPDGLYNACMQVAYGSYVKACQAENLDPHSYAMWEVHGYPLDSLGTRMDWSLERVPA